MKNKFEVFTKKDYKSIPSSMIFVKDKNGWMFLKHEGTQWFVNHTNTFTSKSKETNEEIIKLILKQIKTNKEMIKDVTA